MRYKSGKQLFIGAGGKTPKFYTNDSEKESLRTTRPEAIDPTTSKYSYSIQVYIITPGQKIVIREKILIVMNY